MPIYRKVPPEVAEIVNAMVEQFHQPLRDHGVTIDLLFAFAKTDELGETDGVALKHHGYRAAAVTRVVPYKQRVQGHADAEITIDGTRWDEWSEEEQRAIIDHELEHLEAKTDADGLLLRDDCDRPKLRLRLHDHQFGWFDSVARRHGPASVEVKQFQHMIEHHRQMYFDFDGGAKQEPLAVGDSNGTVETPTKKARYPKKRRAAMA